MRGEVGFKKHLQKGVVDEDAESFTLLYKLHYECFNTAL